MALKSQNHEELMKLLQVSRETIRSLNIYEALLLENNRKLNLISKSTENIIKTRHILDSAQIIDFIDKNSKICVDLGTGAGFPGIVLSILFKEIRPKTMGQALRIDGITPAAVYILLSFVKRKSLRKTA